MTPEMLKEIEDHYLENWPLVPQRSHIPDLIAEVKHLQAEARRTPDPQRIIEAVHALATAPAPFAQVLEAIRAIEPITAQLKADKGITALGHTVDDVIRLGAAQAALDAWLNGRSTP